VQVNAKTCRIMELTIWQEFSTLGSSYANVCKEVIVAVTIKDIARRAGVAHTTVSRALRGSPLISVEVAERIRQIAVEMNYHPSAAARSLKTNRTQVLGVIISHIADPFFSEMLQGIDDVAQASGYSLFIASAQHDGLREQSIVKTMRENRVDGVIICSTPFSAGQGKQLLADDTPIVVVNNQSAEDYHYSIYHDDLDGSRQVTRHLLEMGHRQIAYLGNSQSGRTNYDRLSGYTQELESAGLPVLPEYIHEVESGLPESGMAGLQYFLSLPQPPTAIFCFNDLLAMGVLRGLRNAGMCVPHECSVAGFDNISFSAYTNPALTTFDQPKRPIGAEAARLLLALLDPLAKPGGKPQQKVQVLKGRLLVRESTARPPIFSQQEAV
jgi:DNA-binding LacI/PurR family transcriptional regulator